MRVDTIIVTTNELVTIFACVRTSAALFKKMNDHLSVVWINGLCRRDLVRCQREGIPAANTELTRNEAQARNIVIWVILDVITKQFHCRSRVIAFEQRVLQPPNIGGGGS
ncbi:hypothetical protein BVG81_003185 [Haliangium sp. UPWRP_2]|nr:hypothetical protein BVG81_003185 [Haliangium sp. UPWRP_2]